VEAVIDEAVYKKRVSERVTGVAALCFVWSGDPSTVDTREA
jgi:hypothetical protein